MPNVKLEMEVIARGLAAPVMIGPSAALLPKFRAQCRIDGAPVTVDFEVVEGRPVPVSIALRGEDANMAVTPGLLRRVATILPRLVERASAQVLIRLDVDERGNATGGQGGTDEVEQLLDVTRAQRRRVTRPLLEQVAAVWAESNGSLRALQRCFTVSPRTAYRYVSLAREAGLVPEEEMPPKRKAATRKESAP